MRKVKLQIEYVLGSIWCFDENGRHCETFKIIKNDKISMNLDDQIMALYDECFIDNQKEFSVDENKLNGLKEEIISLSEQLYERLVKINDGSYIVENRIPEEFK